MSSLRSLLLFDRFLDQVNPATGSLLDALSLNHALPQPIHQDAPLTPEEPAPDSNPPYSMTTLDLPNNEQVSDAVDLMAQLGLDSFAQ